jgi:hypothetical protein
MPEKLFEEISISLKQVSLLIAYTIINKNEEWKSKTNREKISFLSQLSYSADDIALLVGTTPGTVRKEISIIKKMK